MYLFHGKARQGLEKAVVGQGTSQHSYRGLWFIEESFDIFVQTILLRRTLFFWSGYNGVGNRG